MKILHFSDTHLGFNDLDILNEDNINQREADFYDAFLQVVEDIKKIKPDFIIHSGDLFHRSNPTNRAITFALKQFNILNSMNIPIILIAGNHSTPRTNFSAPILEIFEDLENVYVAYKQKLEIFEFEDINFFALPHTNDEEKILDEIEKLKPQKDKKNILIMHCSVGASYLMSEFGEWVFPSEKEEIFNEFDYVALGHWHGFGNVKNYENVFYSGSTERTSLNDKRNSKGYIVVNLDENLKVEYKEIKIRTIKSFEIDCTNDILNELQNIDKSNLKGAIVDIKLKNLTPLKSIEISSNEIKEIFDEALHVNIKREFIQTQNQTDISDIKALSLEDYFLEYIKNESDEDFEQISQKVKELFASCEEEDNDSY